ncbi:MAG: tetratricopeptide repeat protein [Tepidisphaerales bacterium]
MRPWVRAVVPSLVVLLAVLAVFGPVLRYPFLEWDDHLTLATNPAFNPPSLNKVAVFWREPHLALYVPVTYTVWGVLAFLAWDGQTLQAWPFRAASVLLHAVAAVVVMGVVRGVLQARGHPQAVAASAVAGVLFAVHPVQVESVAWASGLKDVLAGLLGWSAVGCGLAALAGGRTWRGWARWTAAGALLAGAMLAKPSAVVFPLVFAIVAGVSGAGGAGRGRAVVVAVAAGLAMAVPVAWAARAVQPPNHGEVAPLLWRPVLALDALGFYVRHVVWPWPLAVDYGRSPKVQLADPWMPLQAAVPAVLAGVLWAASRHTRKGWAEGRAAPGPLPTSLGLVGGGLAAAAVLLLPVLGLVPFQYQRYSAVADHYLYAAMGGVVLAVAALLWRWWAMVVAWAAAGMYALLAAAYVPSWADTVTLFTHTERVTPASFAAHRVLGFHAARQGDDAAAETHYRTALRLRPDDAETHFNLGNLLLRRGQWSEAAACYESALSHRADLTPALLNLAVARERAGDVSGAREAYRRVLEREPGHPAAAAGMRRLSEAPDGPR